ncbi:S8 family serine peptidase [Pseudonocardia hydrocarbonoxydans]|uniref:Cyclic nucleotide-binding domain-containing protein n=1 Tax=Pseudonocardia hydrocarbonoxydans TaxID=76726 RepID=A0A4Y3WQF8_9PSEU|nr:S8 family serine peptidase [Pseudonocardia hydrocarbonoxydans]GEC21065.1 hypothetical protein PHY01_33480 [Pseudonocardia hydrocarbonoxydans]
MTLPPGEPPPEPEPQFDGGVPSGFVILVLRTDPDVDDLRRLVGDDVFGELARLLVDLGSPRNERLIPRAAAADADRLDERARRRRPDRRNRRSGRLYWRVDRRESRDAAEVARRLAALRDVVDTAYAEARVAAASPSANASTAAASTTTMLGQGYLDARPHGVDARSAWTRPGGEGQGVRLVDIEMGWRITHPALAAHTPKVLPDPHRVNRDGIGVFVGDHGTATLGVIAATGPGVPVLGIAPRIAWLRACSHFNRTTGDDLDVTPAIVQAATYLRAGDVLVLETQRLGLFGLLPTETDLADFDHIQKATDAGIVVIEAAANGSRDIDAWRPAADQPQRRLQRGVEEWDSGAVLVGSCVKRVHQDGHRRHPTSNYGRRVDCYAWGEGVAAPTATATSEGYFEKYAGTSSATAIIAGVAVLVESLHRAAHGGRAVAPETVRDVLSAPAPQGTPQKPVGDARLIGVMPDLDVIFAAVQAAPLGPELPDDDIPLPPDL